MSDLNKSDIVEFLCDNGDSKFGLIIDIHSTDSIDALVVADLGGISKPYWIPRHRVKGVWSNIQGYITRYDMLYCEMGQIKGKLEAKTAEIKRLEGALKDMCELWESMGTQIPPLLNEQKYLNVKAIVGTDTNVPANAPDTNDGTIGGEA